MRILDDGHLFSLDQLDAKDQQILRFVKRDSPPEKYPGNKSAYPGVTNQEVCRALISRLKYLDKQVHWWGNHVCITSLRLVIWLHEYRALLRKNKPWYCFPQYQGSIEDAFVDPSDLHILSDKY